MTKEERIHFLAAFKNSEDYENWLYFARLMLFTALCFFGALFIAGVILR